MLVDTGLQCDGFVPFFQKYIALSQVLSQMIWQFVSAFLTDSTERIAPYLLFGTLILQVILDASVFVHPHVAGWFGGTLGVGNEWVLLAQFVVRFALVQQVTNSVLKVFKMRIQLVLKVPVDQQLANFNSLTVTGEFLGRTVSILLSYVVFITMANMRLLSFEASKAVFFATVSLFNIIVIGCCATLNREYCMKTTPAEPTATTMGDETDDMNLGKDDALEELIEDCEDDEEAVQEEDMTDLDDPEVNEKFVILRSLIYFKRSLAHVLRKTLLVCINIHFWSIMIIVGFVTIVLRFSVTNPGDNKGSRDNFCNGLIFNLVENQLYMEITKIGGAIVFQVYMNRLKPFHYFRYIYIGLTIVMGGLCGLNFIDLGPTGGSIVLSFITVIIFLGMIYDANLGGTIAPPAISGFVYGLQGSILQLLALTPILFVYLIEKNYLTEKFVVSLCVGLCVWAALFGLFISFKFKTQLKKLSESETKMSKMKRCMFGS